MEVLSTIRRIIAHLSDEEKVIVKTYLSVFYHRSKPVKTIRLWEILLSEQKREEGKDVASAAEIEILLYGKSASKSFSQLLYRLREKMLEALTIDVNVEREGVYDEKTKVNIDIRKKLTQIQILQNRGMLDLAQAMLLKVVDLAKKYELYDELLMAIRLQIDTYAPEKGDKHLSNLNAQYEKFSYARSAVFRAEVNRSRVFAEVDFRSGQNAKADWLKPTLDEMVNDYKKTSSANVGFIYFYILTQHYQILEDHKGARKALQDNLKLLEVNPSIYSRIRVGNVMINLADNDLFLGEFDRAYKTAFGSLSHFRKTSFNHTQALEIMFYSQYYLGNYAEANDIILQLLPDLDETTGQTYRQGKRRFLMGCSLFMKGEFRYALKLVNMTNPIIDDKEGWNVGIRLISIMNLIELGNFDEAAAAISALRIFVDSQDKKIIGERMNLISIILRKLSNASFNFKETYQKEKERIEKLESMPWKPKSAEMVIFHQWFFAKVSKQNFVQKIPDYQSEVTIKRKPITIKSE